MGAWSKKGREGKEGKWNDGREETKTRRRGRLEGN